MLLSCWRSSRVCCIPGTKRLEIRTSYLVDLMQVPTGAKNAPEHTESGHAFGPQARFWKGTKLLGTWSTRMAGLVHITHVKWHDSIRAPNAKLFFTEILRVVINWGLFSRFHGNSRNAAFYVAFCWILSPSAKYRIIKFANCRQKPDKAEHRAGARYEPCAPRITTPYCTE